MKDLCASCHLQLCVQRWNVILQLHGLLDFLVSEIGSPQQDPAFARVGTVPAAAKRLGSTIAAFNLRGEGGQERKGGGQWQVCRIGSALQVCNKCSVHLMHAACHQGCISACKQETPRHMMIHVTPDLRWQDMAIRESLICQRSINNSCRNAHPRTNNLASHPQMVILYCDQ